MAATSAEMLVVGLSHHTAPLPLRERLAVGEERLPDELGSIMQGAALDEGLLVSTCNRVELYATSHDAHAAVEAARRYLDERSGGEDVGRYLYERRSADAVRHAFRVTSSLDSMVVGEPQILGQVKRAYDAASATGTVGTLLGRCFTRAFAVAKRVRSETAIAEGTVSVSSIAGELARKIFGSLEGRRVLLVGAGKMGESAARNLRKSGAKLVVLNRSPERARELAQSCGGEAREYEALAEELVLADVVITSTGSERHIVGARMMRDVVRARKHRPLFMIDIAVPRDVDPRVGEVDSIFLYDVDDLQQVAEENIAARRRALPPAEQIVAEEVEAFERWYRSLSLKPTIVALRERFRQVVRAELERTVPRLESLGPKERKSLDKMGDAIVNKLLHAPLTHLREGAEQPDGAQLIDAARRLFELEAAQAQQPERTKAPAAAAESGREQAEREQAEREQAEREQAEREQAGEPAEGRIVSLTPARSGESGEGS